MNGYRLGNVMNEQSIPQSDKAAANGAQRASAGFNINPTFRNIYQLCRGRNPKDVFYEECQRRGVNPDDILNQLR